MELTKSRSSSTPETSNGATPSLEKIEQTSIDSTYEEAPYFDTDDSIETSLQAKILQLSHQGYDADEIAGKLNCGKTEAALIIKLQEKNRCKDRKSTRLNSSHVAISYAVFCL